MKAMCGIARVLAVVGLILVVLLVPVLPVLAQGSVGDGKTNSVTFAGPGVGAAIGAGLTIIGAGFGFGKIGAAALESMARQPEVAPRVQTAMIVIGALLEGATFFALIVCILVAQRGAGLL